MAHQVSKPRDPMIYASLVTASLQSHNPWTLLVERVYRTWRVLWNLKRNMRAAEIRIAQLNRQLQALEDYINPSTSSPDGQRLNKIR